MPEPIHEIPACWLGSLIQDLSRRLEAVVPCGTPELRCEGTGNVKWKGFAKQPDQSIILRWRFPHDKIYTPRYPRVVMETAYSQSLKSAMDSAVEYLYKTEGEVHAVIVCDLAYPIKKDTRFSAEISVWIREPTGVDGEHPDTYSTLADGLSIDIDNPVENIPHDHDVNTLVEYELASDGSQSESSGEYSNATLVSDEHTRVDPIMPKLTMDEKIRSSRTYPLEGNGQKIRRRTEHAIVRQTTEIGLFGPSL
jgi:hypothetical protein